MDLTNAIGGSRQTFNYASNSSTKIYFNFFNFDYPFNQTDQAYELNVKTIFVGRQCATCAFGWLAFYPVRPTVC